MLPFGRSAVTKNGRIGITWEQASLAPISISIKIFRFLKLFASLQSYMRGNVTKKPKKEPTVDDSRLMSLIKQGKTEYIGEIAARYYDDIYRFLCFKTGDSDLAGDLTQETFLRFIRYLDGYRERNLKGYLLTLAMNVCRDHWKTESRHSRERSWEQLQEEGRAEGRQRADAGYDWENGGEQEEAARLELKEALLKLPEFQRDAILLHYYYGFKDREIGKMTGTAVSTVKSRIRQGCLKLRELLGQDF